MSVPATTPYIVLTNWRHVRPFSLSIVRGNPTVSPNISYASPLDTARLDKGVFVYSGDTVEFKPVAPVTGGVDVFDIQRLNSGSLVTAETIGFTALAQTQMTIVFTVSGSASTSTYTASIDRQKDPTIAMSGRTGNGYDPRFL